MLIGQPSTQNTSPRQGQSSDQSSGNADLCKQPRTQLLQLLASPRQQIDGGTVSGVVPLTDPGLDALQRETQGNQGRHGFADGRRLPPDTMRPQQMIENGLPFEKKGLSVVGPPPNHRGTSPVYFRIADNVIVVILFADLKPAIAKKPSSVWCRVIDQHPFTL